jgi:nucleotide-binding universal stress UspA family protein
MTIKDILIHVGLAPAAGERLALAAYLARRFDARLNGVGRAGDTPAQEQFMAVLERTKLIGDWFPATGDPAEFLIRRARAADLVILGQPDPDVPGDLDSPEDVILGCGRPVLVVPCKGWGFLGSIGDIVLVAWNGSREATRAVHDSLPMIAQTAALTLFSVFPDPEEDWLLGGAVVEHLAHHGLDAMQESAEPEDVTASEAVLDRVRHVNADLLVMGAYGHSRLHEMILGSMTRDILQRMTVPVLMSH